MKWASTLSREQSPRFAIAEALESIDTQLSGVPADVIFAFVYPRQTDQYTLMVEAIAERYPSAALVGCSAAGVRLIVPALFPRISGSTPSAASWATKA